MFGMIRNLINRPEKSFSWAFVFGCHAILTCVFETQAICREIETTAKGVYDKYFVAGKCAVAKLQEKRKAVTWTDMQQNVFNYWHYSVASMRDHPCSDAGLWNPVMAGTLL